MSRRRHSRRDVSPRTERDTYSDVSSRRLSLSDNYVSLYGEPMDRHTVALDARTVEDFVNRLGLELPSEAQRRREGLRKVLDAPRDRRFWHPDEGFAGATLGGREATVYEASKYARDSALTCYRRRERREVMFARGHGGKAYRKPHRWTEFSERSCR